MAKIITVGKDGLIRCVQNALSEEAAARDRLEAAAPDLLAACKMIVEAHPLNGNTNCAECKASRAAEAAIAKAEGK